jgi:cytochrome P450
MRRASVGDTLRAGWVLASVFAQGPVLRRSRMVRFLAWLDADRRGYRTMRRLRWKYRDGLVRLRIPGRPVVLVLSVAEVRSILNGAPEPYTPASREKVAALTHFQPHGVLVSHGPGRAARRRLNEAVLETGHPVHRHGAGFAEVIREEVAAAAFDGELTWDGFSRMWWRVVRRIVLGNGARDDEQLVRMLNTLRSDANWAYLRPKRDGLRRRFEERLRFHLDRAEPGSLAGLLATTAAGPETDPAGQVPHWLFAFDAAGIAAYRALLLLPAAPDARADLAYLQAAVLESLRLWPTTLVLLRDSTGPVDGAPAGSAYVIVPAYHHRDPDLLDEPDLFTPDLWLSGRGADNWALMPFSRGPAACPGRNLVLLTTGLLLATLRERHTLVPVRPLDPGASLPGTVEHTALRYAVGAPAPGPVDLGPGLADPLGVVPVSSPSERTAPARPRRVPGSG